MVGFLLVVAGRSARPQPCHEHTHAPMIPTGSNSSASTQNPRSGSGGAAFCQAKNLGRGEMGDNPMPQRNRKLVHSHPGSVESAFHSANPSSRATRMTPQEDVEENDEGIGQIFMRRRAIERYSLSLTINQERRIMALGRPIFSHDATASKYSHMSTDATTMGNKLKRPRCHHQRDINNRECDKWDQ